MKLHRSWWAVSSALWVWLGAAACGPMAINLCYSNCAYQKRCLDSSDARYESCLRSCNDRSGTLADADRKLARDCSNAPQIRDKQAACYGRACAEVPGCLIKNTELLLCEKT